MMSRIALAGIAALCAVAVSRPVMAQGGAMKWTATLAPQGDSKVSGTATVEPGKSAGTTMVTVSISGGTPGTTYPWHVHTGKCGGGGVWGTASAYKPIKAGTDGTGKGSATISEAPPSSGDYHVNIHDPKTMAPTACGDLAMAGM
jgi:hypothetical protein